MKFFRIAIKSFAFLYFFFKLGSRRLAYKLAHYHLPLQTMKRIGRSGSDLVFTETGNRIPLKNALVYEQELRSLVAVLNHPGVKVHSIPDENSIVLNIDGVKLTTSGVSNIFTAFEIYLEKLYDFSPPSANNVILDIGMNAAYATLFFARLPGTAKVYSFEPFPETYAEATKNIALNPLLSTRINAMNYGLSDTSKTVEVPMMESGSAIASTSNLFIEHNKVVSNSKVVVKVKGIIEVLDEIVPQHPGQPVFLKVDCEGEEYAIMAKLDSSDHMKKLSGFFIEWHIKGPEAIVKVLNNHGFTSLHIPRVGVDSGMIYAFK